VGAGLELADIVRAHGDAFVARHGGRLSCEELNALYCIAICRTARAGGRLYRCDDEGCGREVPLYNSCNNRHCPKCQGLERERWRRQRQAEVLPVPYFHLTFTLPHSLNGLQRQNRELFFNLLLRCGARTILELGADPRWLGAEMGFWGMLQSWGEALTRHAHGHYLVPGGGLSAERDRWVRPPREDYLFPNEVLGDRFRTNFLAGLERAYRRHELHLGGRLAEFEHPVRFEDLMQQHRGLNWVADCSAASADGDNVVEYLGRYLNRTAISNHRLLALEEGRVRFRWKDYRDGETKEMDLPVEEFLRRFLMHVLPRRFVRLRYYGLLAYRKRAENLARCRELLGATAPEVEPLAEDWAEADDRCWRL
jgi:Putative transposase/Transposase zinc-binding domain